VITLYNARRCPYCVRVRLVLAEKRIEHEVVEIDLADRAPILRTLNPRNRVPVLLDGDLVLPESAVINEYLEERVPEPPLLPPDAAGRAQVRHVVEVFEDFTDAYYAFRRSSESLPELREQLGSMEARLGERDYLVGESLTLADAGCWPWLARLPGMGVDLGDFPAVAGWVGRLGARPTFVAEAQALAVR
jgi:glutathione S-transferase